MTDCLDIEHYKNNYIFLDWVKDRVHFTRQDFAFFINSLEKKYLKSLIQCFKTGRDDHIPHIIDIIKNNSSSIPVVVDFLEEKGIFLDMNENKININIDVLDNIEYMVKYINSVEKTSNISSKNCFILFRKSTPTPIYFRFEIFYETENTHLVTIKSGNVRLYSRFSSKDFAKSFINHMHSELSKRSFIK